MQYTGRERENDNLGEWILFRSLVDAFLLRLAYSKPQPLLYFLIPLIIIVISY